MPSVDYRPGETRNEYRARMAALLAGLPGRRSAPVTAETRQENSPIESLAIEEAEGSPYS